MKNRQAGPPQYSGAPGACPHRWLFPLLVAVVMLLFSRAVLAIAQEDFYFQRGSISLERSTSYRRDSKEENISWDIEVKLKGELKSVSKELQTMKGRPFRTQVLEISSLNISLFEGSYSYSIKAYDSEKGEYTEEGLCHISQPRAEGFGKDIIVFLDAKIGKVKWVGVPTADLSYEWAGSEYCASEYDRVDYTVEPLEDNQREEYNEAGGVMGQPGETPERDSGDVSMENVFDLTEQYVSTSHEPLFKDYIVTSGDGVRSFGGGGESFSEDRSGNSHTTLRESFSWRIERNQ